MDTCPGGGRRVESGAESGSQSRVQPGAGEGVRVWRVPAGWRAVRAVAGRPGVARGTQADGAADPAGCAAGADGDAGGDCRAAVVERCVRRHGAWDQYGDSEATAPAARRSRRSAFYPDGDGDGVSVRRAGCDGGAGFAGSSRGGTGGRTRIRCGRAEKDGGLVCGVGGMRHAGDRRRGTLSHAASSTGDSVYAAHGFHGFGGGAGVVTGWADGGLCPGRRCLSHVRQNLREDAAAWGSEAGDGRQPAEVRTGVFAGWIGDCVHGAGAVRVFDLRGVGVGRRASSAAEERRRAGMAGPAARALFRDAGGEFTWAW
jgi:hypothetical protein